MDGVERGVAEELDREEASGEDTEVVRPRAPAGDRRWTDEEKALVVRECCWPGVKVGEVARRHGLSASQVSAWRGLARRGKLTSPGSEATKGVVAEARAERSQAGGKAGVAAPGSVAAFAELEVEEETTAVGSVSIEARGVTVRLEGAIGTVRIAEIASALRGLR